MTDEPLDLTGDEPAKDNKKKDKPSPPPRKPSAAKQGERQKAIKESLGELADWMKERDVDEAEPEEIADVIRRDADKIAVVLTALSEKHDLIARLCDRVFGIGGPLSVLRAFGPLGRHVLGPLLVFRRESGEGENLDEEPDGDAAVFPPA
jgi:hypothetical protein